MKQPIVGVGVGVVVVRDRKILLGRRLGKLGYGTWGFPGGGVEFKETIEECSRRELEEETGMTAEGFRKIYFDTNFHPEENYHCVTLFTEAYGLQGEPVVCEPNKCSEWRWFDWSDLPSPLFLPTQTLIASGFIPSGL